MATPEIHTMLQKLVTEITGDARFLTEIPTNYRKRVIAQKIVYLLQSLFRMKERWSFNWYIAGPYSPSLARDLYAVAEDFDQVAEQAVRARFTDSAARKVAKLKALATYDYRAIELNQAEWLELLASADYIAKWKNKELTDPSLSRLVTEGKPWFDHVQITAAINALRD